MGTVDSNETLAVELRGLCRRFGRRWALAGVDLEVPRGTAVMVTGANGSGKTTMLRCIATAIPTHAGVLRVHGHDAWAERHLVRPRVSLVSHAMRLYDDLSGRDNLLVWARLGAIEADTDALLARVGLPSDRRDPVRTYSAGMRRRLALAIALLKPADVFLFDEPFAALDPQGRDMVGRVIDDLRARGTTVLVATHLPAVTGPHCDRAIHLDGGRLVWKGLPSQAPAVEPIEEPA